MYHSFMPKAWDIVAYMFQADIWCRDCMREYAIEQVNQLIGADNFNPVPFGTEETIKRWAQEVGIDPDDESSYDSDDFPKVVFHSQVEDVEHCGQCGKEI